MNILIFQHAVTEHPGTLTDWIKSRGYRSTVHRWYIDPRAPDTEGFDWLIVLGGAMGVDQDKEHPWLKEEKMFLKDWLAQKRPYLGLCLGGQLLAQCLGGKISANKDREIGFHEVRRNGKQHPALRRWPETARVYQFHEDTFSLPPGCENLLESPACQNQAFSRDDRTLGIQFHPESSRDWIIANTPSIKPRGGERWVQPASATLAEMPETLPPMTGHFFRLLDDFAAGLK